MRTDWKVMFDASFFQNQDIMTSLRGWWSNQMKLPIKPNFLWETLQVWYFLLFLMIWCLNNLQIFSKMSAFELCDALFSSRCMFPFFTISYSQIVSFQNLTHVLLAWGSCAMMVSHPTMTLCVVNLISKSDENNFLSNVSIYRPISN